MAEDSSVRDRSQQQENTEKLRRYRERLSEQEPLKESYHDHKENIMIVTIGFLVAVNLFLFDNLTTIISKSPNFFAIALLGFATVYYLGMRILHRQVVLKRGAAAHSAAINSELWSIANGNFNTDTIGIEKDDAAGLKLEHGITDSRYAAINWSKSYLETYMDSYQRHTFKDFDFQTMIIVGILGFFTASILIFEAWEQGLVAALFNSFRA